MNILISSNDNYKVPTMVMLTSFFDCNPEKHTVYMLESALSDGADAKIRELVGKYGADYVFVSSYERSDYDVDEDWLDEHLPVVFRNGECTVYRAEE